MKSLKYNSPTFCSDEINVEGGDLPQASFVPNKKSLGGYNPNLIGDTKIAIGGYALSLADRQAFLAEINDEVSPLADMFEQAA